MEKDLHATNRAHWDDRTDLHLKTQGQPGGYDLQAFRSGTSTLHPAEVTDLGNVHGQTMLHLACHMGLDTLSWARLGAKVTGADLSPKAIAVAQQLATETGLEARFIATDIESLPGLLDETFDIVYISRGVLMWLPSLTALARVVAHFLKPGGRFYLLEMHPLTDCLEPIETPAGLKLAAMYDYFDAAIQTTQSQGSYTDRQATLPHATNHQWQHTLGEVVTSLAAAGLKIEALHEDAEGFFARYPNMTRIAPTRWVLPESLGNLPLAYRLLATRPL